MLEAASHKKKKKMSRRSSRTVCVGNLPGDIREREVEDLFLKYGHITHIDLKVPPRPPGYAFVEFEDAQDAIRGRDGYDFDAHRLRVEAAHGGRDNSSSRDRYSSHSNGRGGRGVSRRSEYRVLVTGLPSSASWQDLLQNTFAANSAAEFSWEICCGFCCENFLRIYVRKYYPRRYYMGMQIRRKIHRKYRNF